MRRVVGMQAERLRQAIANDNQGQWFLAYSRHAVSELERQFRNGMVGRALYQRVGGLLQGPKGYVYIQIALKEDRAHWSKERGVEWQEVDSSDATKPEWAVQVCLQELSIRLIKPLTLAEVLSTTHF